MRSTATAIVLALFAATAVGKPAPSENAAGTGEAVAAISAYLEESSKKVELERIVDRYSTRDSDATSKGALEDLRPMLDAAHTAAAGSETTQAALDDHWLVVNRCLNVGGESRFEKSRQHAACEGDLASAKAKVELVWSRHKP